eukprot:gene4016-4295_t
MSEPVTANTTTSTTSSTPGSGLPKSASNVSLSNQGAPPISSSATSSSSSSATTNNNDTYLIPNFLKGDVLVPLKIDVTYKGARYVDTFCWSLYYPAISPEEFAMITCHDLNFPIGFHQKISLQIIEQLQAYHILIDCVKSYSPCIPNWNQKIRQPQTITIGIRHGPLDYSDKVEWDPMDTLISPEEFARTTCSDLGLPSEIEPAIAHKIREALFRWMLNIVQNPNATDTNIQIEFKVPETRVSLVPPNQAVDMVTNLWKRAKPNTMEEIAAVPQPQLPTEKETNANVWLQSYRAPAPAAPSTTNQPSK